MNRDAYEARILFERWQARVWLKDQLEAARRRYWTWEDDPIRREDEQRKACDAALWRLEMRAGMTVIDPLAGMTVVEPV